MSLRGNFALLIEPIEISFDVTDQKKIMATLAALQLQTSLRKSLWPLEGIKKCALLNYPNYGNIGDHLIGLGTVVYITDVLGARIAYSASLKNFNTVEMDNNIDEDTPIFLQGGGNLGDLWYEHQKFREYIIKQYPENPIFILPQTVYFKNEGCLKEAVKVFGSHKNLSIFCRDHVSYEFAKKHFFGCRLYLATDMAFELADMPVPIQKPHDLDSRVLYMKRLDKEINNQLLPDFLDVQLVTEDWPSYTHKWLLEDVVEEWFSRNFSFDFGRLQSVSLRTATYVYREGWQRGITRPTEAVARRKWLQTHPYRAKFLPHDKPFMYDLSLNLVHSGIYQFLRYPGLITSRLHGHIAILFEL